ncbi:WD40 repeat domain-containing protein [Chloropicon primus]|uniref:WD40 repeat domain-containing protein n=1 Tax=Chloropicon primus TaxID=1764295 RepID=A0A5B8MGM8_9CHLO|nr:WD40 repeat domain-containing protein [Chloropicon primus]UPQ98443.1 WD40 repeat domain-containing protein [Chloropicon primus]|eukprot:QDZ19234.1 WD40 repeat domain-containing protein [Chloropicon primus]
MVTKEEEEMPGEKRIKLCEGQEASKAEREPNYLNDPQAYDKWKTLIPYIYDFFTNHHTVWPSLSCRWGPVEKEEKYKRRQKIYLSEQTDPASVGTTDVNKLLVGHADVIKPKVASGDSLSTFLDLSRSPFIKIKKQIYHPGEVNRIRESPLDKSIVATHTDSCWTYLWNMEKQPDRTADKDYRQLSQADMILEGHKDNAEYALAASSQDYSFASGGKDKLVLLWSIGDEVSTLLGHNKERSSVTSGGYGGLVSPTLAPRIAFEGHADTVEDVAFHPKNSHELVSVGDDKSVRFWDARAGSGEVLSVIDADDGDVQSVDWCGQDENLVLTGTSNAVVKVFDRRKLSSGTGAKRNELIRLTHHTKGILCVEWCPNQKGVFASSAEDGVLNVWDMGKTHSKSSDVPPQLLFQHVGHRAEVGDFQWNPEDPWTILSTSNDNSLRGGGGTLQVWRMNDLIYRPEEEVLEELERQREKILGK